MPGRGLEGFRVVECGEMVAASYATKLMADMGAEVVKIETPTGGDSARQRGPFPGKIPHPEKSGLFLYLNTNKRGVTLDLEQARGREIFRKLVGQADLLVHNVHPTSMAAMGLDYAELAGVNPGLVMTSITPFGLSGPHSHYQATDLTLWNAGGLCYLNGGGPGSEDLPPLKAFGQQAGFQAGIHAAVAALGALFARMTNGVGQHIDFSIQETLMAISEFAGIMPSYAGQVVVRFTGNKAIRPLDIMECKDGWIYLCCVEEHQWKGFVDIMDNPEWAAEELFDTRLHRAENWDALQVLMEPWVKEQTVEELYHKAQARRIPFAPVSTMGDLLDSEHLKARGFFAEITHPEAGTLPYPTAPYKLSAVPWTLRRPAPCLGQHNAEVYGELGLTREEIESLHKQGVI
ncbi:MAG: CoA transferase [Deltaproteobacteria bacterium]|nr:CoA transferase [Deltaproteobacteria bacterium]